MATTLSWSWQSAKGKGASVTLRDGDRDGAALCETKGLQAGPLNANPEWLTWKHQAAAESARDAANPGMQARIFDWDLLQAADSLASYETAVKAKHGRVWG